MLAVRRLLFVVCLVSLQLQLFVVFCFLYVACRSLFVVCCLSFVVCSSLFVG